MTTKTTLTAFLKVVLLLFLFYIPDLFSRDKNFDQIYNHIQNKDFFSARDEYILSKEDLSPMYRLVSEAYLNNAFGKHEESNKKLTDLFARYNEELADSLKPELYRIVEDNSLKLYDYGKAKEVSEFMLNNYADLLDKEESDDLNNNLQIWTALQNEPKQKIEIKGESIIRLKKDKLGLDNLPVLVGKDTLDFIFDTGANLSTTSTSVAERLGMRIIPANIKVGSITGNDVFAQLAVSDKISVGNIDIYNIVFLVLPDENLSFPQVDFQISAILGFPVIEAFKEMQITQDGYFIVPEDQTSFSEKSNMAMDGLTPLISIDNKHYTFDTGAKSTILYSPYYLENKEQIDSDYQETEISFAGAGGLKTFRGYKIKALFHISGREILLDVDLLKEDRVKTGKGEYVYGNIGQDLIRKFDKMILNFDKMFIKFE